MEKKGSWWARLAENAELQGESSPRESVVELAGDRRVLIEGHTGVTQYSREKICVKVRYGIVVICGSSLELRHMCRETLCVWGSIDSIHLKRRK